MLNNWSFWLQAPLLHIIGIMKACWIWWSVCVCERVRYVSPCASVIFAHAYVCVSLCVCVAEVSPESGIIADRLFLQPPRYHWIKQTCDLHFITPFILLLNWALETCRGGCWNHIYGAGVRPGAHITAALGTFCIITNPCYDCVQYIFTSIMNLVLEQRKSYLKNGERLILNHFSFICIILLAVKWKHRQFKRDISLKYYSGLFHAALASTVQTHVSVPVIMWYCRHLSSLLVEGQALWCSLVSAPVSAGQTSHRKVLWAAAMRDCDVSQPVYTMTVVTPSRSSFCQGPLTRSSLSLRQRSPLHLTPVLPRAVMSTTALVTCPAVSLHHSPSLAGGMPSCHVSGQCVWKSRWADVF